MSGELRSFQDLQVWQKACDLAEEVFRLTGDFPREDQYGLTSQLRRAVVSIAANGAEGDETLTTLTGDMDSVDKMLFVLHRNLGRNCR